MFGKKCSNCNKKVSRSFDFCPYCANPLRKKEDYGLLGKSDDLNELNGFLNVPLKNTLGGSFFDNILSSAISLAQKEAQKMINQDMKKESMASKRLGSNFELYINGKRINLPGEVAGLDIDDSDRGVMKKSLSSMPKISEELIKSSAKLPRKEAKTQLVRTADKITYEMDTPGLASLSNVLVTKLEDSIEVKAYTDEAVYLKTIQIKLPLAKYSLKQDKLVLEFNTK
jgi:hypothetical protein